MNYMLATATIYSRVKDMPNFDHTLFKEWWHKRFTKIYKHKTPPDLQGLRIVTQKPNQYWQHYMGPIVWYWLHSTSQEAASIDEMWPLLSLVENMIECDVCLGHFQQMVEYFKKNIDMFCFENAFIFSIYMHNLVNKRLGKILFLDIEHLYRLYAA